MPQCNVLLLDQSRSLKVGMVSIYQDTIWTKLENSSRLQFDWRAVNEISWKLSVWTPLWSVDTFEQHNITLLSNGLTHCYSSISFKPFHDIVLQYRHTSVQNVSTHWCTAPRPLSMVMNRSEACCVQISQIKCWAQISRIKRMLLHSSTTDTSKFRLTLRCVWMKQFLS